MEGASLLKDDNDGLDPSLNTTQLLDEIEDLETRLELPFSLKISQKPVSKCQFYIKLWVSYGELLPMPCFQLDGYASVA